MFYCLKISLNMYIFWKSFKLNKYKINPLLIHVKEEESKLRVQIRPYVVFWVCKTHTPILNEIVFF